MQKYIFNLGKLTNPLFSINCNGKLHVFSDPVIMGILNVTPDSFFDGGQYQELNEAVAQAAKMQVEGAEIIDVGGASSRPDAKILSPQEEMDRVLPVVEKLHKTFPKLLLSIDTYHGAVAQEACRVGASIVNDISGGNIDAKMFALVAELKLPYVLSHIQGNPQTMQKNPNYEDVVLEVLNYFTQKISELEQLGVHDIIIDPGFGFGKTIEQNYALLANLKLFKKALNKPILAGLSRKSMLYKPLNISPQESLSATIAANVLALQNGASMLRVHDVKEAKQSVAIWSLMQQGQNSFTD